MDRITLPGRPGWEDGLRADGLVYVDTVMPDGSLRSYWNEHAAYRFTADEITRIEAATAELVAMHAHAAELVVEQGWYERLAIPDEAAAAIETSWRTRAPSVYGRFDIGYDGERIKLLEFNADTPTSLPEAAFVQLRWLAEAWPDDTIDQWNVLDDALVDRWRELRTTLPTDRLHFVFIDEPTGEDVMNTSYQANAARRAGFDPVLSAFSDLRFTDDGVPMTWDGEVIRVLFKLYPWEWLATRVDAPKVFAAAVDTVTWIEPPYKLLWSNKAMLPLLWELFPGHELLLPTYADGPRDLREVVRKPIFGREGANVTILRGDDVVADRSGPYGDEGFIWQEYLELPTWDTEDGPATPCLGVWVVGDVPAGLGVRESYGPITDNLSRFTPHIVELDTGG